MDILTQGLAGAVIASSMARPQQLRTAAAIGLFAGLLADLDVLIRSQDDALLFLDFHRHFTHALVFVPFGALIAALVAWPFARRRLAFPAIWEFALLGYLPSGLIDACTSYGTSLLWPFSDARVAWRVISIVDPLFTLVLLTGLLLALGRRSPLPARIALAMALLYLLFGLMQRERAEAVARELAASRGHVIERIVLHPTLGNVLLWRSVYSASGQYHVDGVRVGLLSAPLAYRGGSLPQYQPGDLPRLQTGSVLARDIARFTHFSDGFVARHPDRPDVLGDVRYALLPNSTLPLWGIRLDLAQQDRHVEFLTFRQHGDAERRAFAAMLLGQPLPAP
ncbi:metal-dependent hydrolase [Betaproteobacteria bacterium SCN2]|jgi:inner membrane protein|nr:metal-dependent hydrolase [Betaproteobacteria bacterium SCN2]